MKRPFTRAHGPIGFNMTGIIDVVFLLIIFFMIVCQFITVQNFEVTVPDDISSAEQFTQTEESADQATVTVMLDDDGQVRYAVGAKLIESDRGDVADLIAAAIDRIFEGDDVRRTVSLRIERDVCFKDTQYALAGIGQSIASNMKLAVVKDKRY